ncbi:hypothetical protein NIES4073_31780 [Kalymmatonema gypsitolerans NIES-4073]|jgi:hypothetical protein|nr:hypothetical protein NIES4073_31780 [Scytonema sp. NIES-4073]
MKKKYVLIGIISTILALSGILATEPASAKDECGTKKIQQTVEKIAREVVVNKFKFPAPIGVRTSIDRCRYYSQEGSNLVTARVTWNGPLKGSLYDTTVFFLLDGTQWDYQLLGANDSTREYMMGVHTWFSALTGTGKLATSTSGSSYNEGPFK